MYTVLAVAAQGLIMYGHDRTLGRLIIYGTSNTSQGLLIDGPSSTRVNYIRSSNTTGICVCVIRSLLLAG